MTAATPSAGRPAAPRATAPVSPPRPAAAMTAATMTTATAPAAVSEHRTTPTTASEHRTTPATASEHRTTPATASEHRTAPTTASEHRTAPRPRPPLALDCAAGWLVARFSTPHTTASWAITGGGLTVARAVAWLQVGDRELPPGVDPAQLLRDRLAAAGLAGAVGLLTSRRVDTYSDVTVRDGDAVARCIATVGLGNALRAGDPPGPPRVGTINLLCRIAAPLSPEAQLEALALAAEARTLAVREAGVTSLRTGLPASGTGTDCIVIAAPCAPDGATAYAGKHTAIGHVIGAAVLDATRQGVVRWQLERACAAPGEAAR